MARASHRLSRGGVRALLAFAAVSGVGSGAAPAQEDDLGLGPPATTLLVDDRLDWLTIRIVRLDESELVYETKYGRQRRMRREDIAAILPGRARGFFPVEEGISAGAGTLELTDGQEFPGSLGLAPAGSEDIVWNHEAFGELRFPLGRVRSFARAGAMVPAPDPEGVDDMLLLVNGDLLEGFLAEIGDPALFEGIQGEVEIDQELIAAAWLASRPSDPQGMRVWLSDGTVAQASRLEMEEGESVSLELESGAAPAYEFGSLRGLVIDAAQLMALSTLEPISQQAGAGRRFAPPIERLGPEEGSVVPLEARDLLLPGPMKVEYALPDGTRRFAGRLRLQVGSAPWGDCNVIMRLDGIEVFRTRLVAGAEGVEFNIETPGQLLEIEVEEGRFGPINDRVVIELGLLLIEPAAR